ncbi:hypothetical protein F4777DRAFT_556378 [Nemania sp. FL0916]|nr:hypothetical protein F4777DRAFT_556378 [Nemania sp. FL0916]
MLLLCLVLLIDCGVTTQVTPLEAKILAADANITVLRTELAPPWATTSPVRSTANILWSSALTLSLAVYTVIHVNIPPQDESKWRFYRRKAVWVTITVLLPEAAVGMAWQQLYRAYKLRSELQDLARKSHKDLDEYGLTYCFYAIMGGFMATDRNNDNTVTISAEGLVSQARAGRWIVQSNKGIHDKSKADLVAKLLVYIQVSWLVVQCIGRRAKNLPIALLEVHVVAHVISALILFSIWFKRFKNLR